MDIRVIGTFVLHVYNVGYCQEIMLDRNGGRTGNGHFENGNMYF
jgi:hypothetical protein